MSYGMRGSYPHWICKSLDERLPYPHYSDPQWNKPLVVFGTEKAPATSGEYSDRLAQWDYEKHRSAWDAVTVEDKQTPRAIQEYLSNYYDRPVELVTIIYQTNVSNGYNVAFYRWNWKGDRSE